ncbi:MAG: hypothetical protein ACJA05_002394, partial [Porticoccus sp.]
KKGHFSMALLYCFEEFILQSRLVNI